ncbi:MAG: polyprenyl synthetase family protein [Pseudomonadota bacterium]
MTETRSAKLSDPLAQIRALVAEDFSAVDKLIDARLYSEVALIGQMSQYIIGSGGKRLRPLVALLSAKALDYSGPHHVDVAVIVELIHTATLLHDDVVDSSKLRRGRETANLVWGNQASVLVGDFLYSRAFQMMVDIQTPGIMDVIADATNTIAQGEVNQLVNCRNPDTTEGQYLRIIHDKTAKLFEAAAMLGAQVSQQNSDMESTFGAYGRHVGTAFQLVDDALDFSASPEELGKNIGDDLAEGKPTLPLLYAMWQGNPEQADTVRTAIVEGGVQHIDDIMAAIESTGAIEYTLSRARSESEKAINALKKVPASPYRDGLLSLAEFAVDRRS